MKAVIQRVTESRVSVDGEVIGEIKAGLLILLGVEPTDTDAEVEWLANKCAKMRIFNDENGIMNRSVMDINGDVMVVSQFTLAANIKKGNRPSYIGAAGHELAIPMYQQFCNLMESITGKSIAHGIFGADMQISLINDGPVTIIADTAIK